MKNEWNILINEISDSQAFALKIGCSPITASVLSNRGIDSCETALGFLNPSLSGISSPFLLKDMDKAVKRISHAILNHQKIMVFGDYDVDGVTATTILYTFFKDIDADINYYIPHRLNEGYSFHASHVDKVLIPNKTDLLITVDCGADSHDAVAAANINNIDVIITDHHSVPSLPPAAHAILNPKQADCKSGLEQLAGVGVAFYLLIALRKHLRDIDFWQNRQEPNLKSFCDLVALGTIGDIVPLTGVNRIITKTGLDVINTNQRAGIKAMITAGKINKGTIDATDVAFKIAPRINAAGRLEHAGMVVDLLCETNSKSALSTAKALNTLNSQRQSLEKKTIEEIESHILENPSILEKKSIILFKQGWHIGILGIAASKLVNKYHRPVILIALDGAKGKGSGRSIPGANLFKLLQECSDTLEGHGGHAMAAGLSIKADNLEKFTEKFNLLVENRLTEESLIKSVNVDCRIRFQDITPVLLDELERLQPFGAGNNEPIFIAKDISIVSSTIVGQNHRRLVLKSSSGSNDSHIMAMHFNTEEIDRYPEHFNHLIFKLQWNRWNNSKSIQMIIEDYS